MAWSAPSERTKSSFAGLATAGHLCATCLRHLDRERPDVAGRAVDQDVIPGLDRSPVTQPEALDREDRRVRQRGRLFERQAIGRDLERALRRADVFRECPDAEREHVPEHAITGLEAGHVPPHGLDRPGHVESDALLPRGARTHEQPGECPAGVQPVEIGPVDCRGLDADEDLVGLRGRRVDVADLDDLGRPVAVAHGRLHPIPAHRIAT